MRSRAVLLHELVHSTGHASRLNRFEEDGCTHKFGSKSYANEELVAELGAGFLSAEAGIFQQVEDDTAAYIASWIAKLQNDKTLIVKAAGKAQKACDYILGEQGGQSHSPSDTKSETANEEPCAPPAPPAEPAPEPIVAPLNPEPEPTIEPTSAEPEKTAEPEPTPTPEPAEPEGDRLLILGDFVDE